jgi:hypothetical protein
MSASGSASMTTSVSVSATLAEEELQALQKSHARLCSSHDASLMALKDEITALQQLQRQEAATPLPSVTADSPAAYLFPSLSPGPLSLPADLASVIVATVEATLLRMQLGGTSASSSFVLASPSPSPAPSSSATTAAAAASANVRMSTLPTHLQDHLLELDMGAAATASQRALLLGTVDALRRENEAVLNRVLAQEEQQQRLAARLTRVTEEMHRDNAREVAALGQVLDRFSAGVGVGVGVGVGADAGASEQERRLGHETPPPPPMVENGHRQP